jgi:hypothetical protein
MASLPKRGGAPRKSTTATSTRAPRTAAKSPAKVVKRPRPSKKASDVNAIVARVTEPALPRRAGRTKPNPAPKPARTPDEGALSTTAAGERVVVSDEGRVALPEDTAELRVDPQASVAEEPLTGAQQAPPVDDEPLVISAESLVVAEEIAPTAPPPPNTVTTVALEEVDLATALVEELDVAQAPGGEAPAPASAAPPADAPPPERSAGPAELGWLGRLGWVLATVRRWTRRRRARV